MKHARLATGKVPQRYVGGLSNKDEAKQRRALNAARNAYKEGVYVARPLLPSFKARKSSWLGKFERKYPGVSLANHTAVQRATGMPVGAIKAILAKGRGAYYSSGSRPNQSAESWALARLASVLMGGPARKIDYHIIQQYGQARRFPSTS